ncbi:EexN family lipoprotein [Sphingopyxis sp. OPL5]|uniref:EexN family lipoprotein n=1 Tax=Sphingopyxis sp. OPL5 TaxID=2486273 RepID=UPI00164EBB98|nr:EexN family lipoprotein [Sphingopyxis sp. OPL5]QNO27955.1 EexN family lipoprotein [Sphingopyxis sp. OPL5]
MRKVSAVLAALFLTACSHREARSVEYFEAHPNVAQEVIAACTDGSVTGAECTNASLAAKVAEDRERFKRFRGK